MRWEIKYFLGVGLILLMGIGLIQEMQRRDHYARCMTFNEGAAFCDKLK